MTTPPPAANDRRPAGRSRLLTWLIAGSLLLHAGLLLVLQPRAQTTMRFDEEQHDDHVQLVAQREELRKQFEDERRQRTPIPEKFREQLKKEAEQRERDQIREKVKRMLEDRKEAERQRERAFEQLKKRDKDEYVKKHVIPEIEKALRNTQEKVDVFKNGKPEEKKSEKDKKLDQRADELVKELEQTLEEMKQDPSTSTEKLNEVEEKAGELRKVADGGRDRGRETHEPSWELANEANNLRQSAQNARKKQAEADKLHDTSEAAEVGEPPAAAAQAAGESGEQAEASTDPEQNAAGDATSPQATSESQQTGGAGGQPDTAALYDAAKTLEKQTEALANDARAAELAQRGETSFGTAKKKLNTHSPARPDLAPKLRENEAGTVGELNEYRDALQQAGNQVASMATRTESMTRGVEAVQQRRTADAARADMIAQAARGRGFGDMTQAGMSDGIGSGSMGDSTGLRAGYSAYDRGDEGPGKQKGEMKLPERMITANALPGRMLTDSSLRKGWLYLDTWYVIGPWNVNYRHKFSTPYPPEYEIDFDAVYTDGKFKDKPDHPYHEMRWQFVQSDEMMLQTPKVFGGETWYAFTEVYSDKTRDMLIAVASDDFAKVWLNDQVVWEDTRESAFDIGEALRKVTFQRGYNRLLVRIGNGPGPLAWSVLLSPPEVLSYVDGAGD